MVGVRQPDFEMTPPDVFGSYSARAEEYANLLGSMESVHVADRELVTDWALDGPVSRQGSELDGPVPGGLVLGGLVLDVGCGPGQWTEHLAAHGVDVVGVDPTVAFVDLARRAYPSRHFEVGRAERLNVPDESVEGILAWYSLIHHHPDEIDAALSEFARVLRIGGSVLIGFFEGPVVEPFDHAVVRAYRWSVDELSSRLRSAGFDVSASYRRHDAGSRPHGALVAGKERPRGE